MSGFHQKITRAINWQERNIIYGDKARIRTRLRYDTEVELSHRELKITMINIERTLMGKVDGQAKSVQGENTWVV